MIKFKMVLIHDEGVFGYVLHENDFGARAYWYIDGLRYESFLEKDEYTVKLVGEICE